MTDIFDNVKHVGIGHRKNGCFAGGDKDGENTDIVKRFDR